MNNDLIAILLATFNGEKYLSEQLDSIFSQTYSNWIIYTHDDGSTDNTLNIINEYIKKYPNKIKYVEGPPTGGAKNNFMYLMSKVKEEYIMFCDQDDVWLDNKIELTIKKMKEVESTKDIPTLIFSDLTVVDKDLNIISNSLEKYQSLNYKKVDYASLLIQNQITGNTVMINKALLNKALVNDTKDIIMHDWWCALVASRFGNIVYIDRQLVLYRQHSNNDEGAKKINNSSYIIKEMKNINRSLEKTRKQAKYFCLNYKMQDKDLSALYSKSDNLNKLNRLLFYKKNNITKSGLVRKIGLIIFG